MATREEVYEGAEVRSIVVVEEGEELPQDYSQEGYDAEGNDSSFNDGFNEEAHETDEFSHAQGAPSNNPYRNDRTCTVLQLGGTEITFGQAKLYGLLDEHGNVSTERLASFRKSGPKKSTQRKHINGLSKPVPIAEARSTDEELTFKPSRPAASTRVMRSCGYDFVDRLDAKTDVLDSLTNVVTKSSDNERAKELYDFGDKLQCPTCKRFQSYDEFTEKKRFCQICQSKYARLNVGDVYSFDRKVKEKQSLREQRLQRVEEEMYGYEKKPFQATPVPRASRGAITSRGKGDLNGKETGNKTLSGDSAQVRRTESGESAPRPLSRALSNAKYATAPMPIAIPPHLAAADVSKGSARGAAEKAASRVIAQEAEAVRSRKTKMSSKFSALLEY